MATTDLSNYDPNKVSDASDMSFAIVVSEWNEEVTEALYNGAYKTLTKHNAEAKNISRYNVPGTFELTFAASQLMDSGRFNAVIVLGCVVQGETKHFDYVCGGVTQGITSLNSEGDTPVIFGVLTTDNQQQALDRAGGKLGNKGDEAAVVAIKMVELKRKISAENEDLFCANF